MDDLNELIREHVTILRATLPENVGFILLLAKSATPGESMDVVLSGSYTQADIQGLLTEVGSSDIEKVLTN